MESVSRQNPHRLLSRIATSDRHGENSPYFDGWKAYDKNPFHLTQNPNGVIQMGLAENQLTHDMVEEWIIKNPKASICTTEGIGKFKDIALFQDYHGLPEFRQAVAKFMGRVRGGKVKFDPNRIVMSGGATGASETLMFCLADPGDAFLVPSPFYPAFARDLRWRTGVELIPIECKSSKNFQLTLEDLESAYNKARQDFPDTNIKGLILTNPSNPLGTTLDRNTLMKIVTFVSQRNIHLVCDEIYSATVFKAPEFVSVSEFMDEPLAEVEGEDHKLVINRELIHIVYSLSKDMGFPGLRVGILYSYNDNVVSCARKMSSFGLVSSQTQHMLAAMLSDEEFIGRFLKESCKRLARRHDLFIKGLEKAGITCLSGNAGLFFWMDLRHLLKDNTFEAEMQLWRLIIDDVKLNVSPGSSFQCSEPGFFRVCFANMDDDTVQIALRRIREFVSDGDKHVEDDCNSPRSPELGKKTRSKWQKNLSLRVSFSARGYDNESIMSPHKLSPHSPILRSPLVRARN